MNINCLRCKGASPQTNCGRIFCPLLARAEAVFKVNKVITNKDFQTQSPAPFIGRFGYPNINVGILSPPEEKEDTWAYDAPRYWATNNYSIKDIIGFRSNLINSNQKSNIKNQDKIQSIAREVGMASAPVDLEVNLEDKPKFKLHTDSYMAPQGPNAKLKKATITHNPKIHTKVDKVVSDTDLKAKDALIYLYKNSFDENFLSKLLSVGTLGVKDNRKLVPTRWSITAADDTLGKNLIEQLKSYPHADFQVFFGSFLGNYYLIILFPDVWSYELFETYMPNASWNRTKEIQYTTDYESYAGRKSYAYNCAGGYYTVRLAIAEKLRKLRKQASVLAIRIITGEYAAPLGVWVTREAARKAMNEKPVFFYSKELMINYAKNFINKKFGMDISVLTQSSIIIKEQKEQKKLFQYL